MTRRHSLRFAAQSIIRDAIISMPGLRVDDDRRGLDGVERADRLADEIRETRACRSGGRACPCVSRCSTDARSECCQVFSSGSKSLTVVPRSTLPGCLDRAGLVQQRLGERGLARCAVPDERHACGCSRWRIAPCMRLLRLGCRAGAILPCRADRRGDRRVAAAPIALAAAAAPCAKRDGAS